MDFVANVHSSNRILAALPADESRRISGLLTTRSLTSRQMLRRRGEPVHEILFPSRTLCSLIITMDDGNAAEIAVVGAEGLIGVEATLGISAVAASDGQVQVAGDGLAQAMSVDAFQRELERKGIFHSLVTSYAQAFTGFVTQSVACNGLHSADARCCRWLLHAQDRLATRELPLTHELLSTMLGVRRPTVTLVIAELIRAGIIETSRGVIRIVDLAALEGRSCECYKVVKAGFDNVAATLPTVPNQGEPQWREHASAAAR